MKKLDLGHLRRKAGRGEGITEAESGANDVGNDGGREGAVMLIDGRGSKRSRC